MLLIYPLPSLLGGCTGSFLYGATGACSSAGCISPTSHSLCDIILSWMTTALLHWYKVCRWVQDRVSSLTQGMWVSSGYCGWVHQHKILCSGYCGWVHWHKVCGSWYVGEFTDKRYVGEFRICGSVHWHKVCGWVGTRHGWVHWCKYVHVGEFTIISTSCRDAYTQWNAANILHFDS